MHMSSLAGTQAFGLHTVKFEPALHRLLCLIPSYLRHTPVPKLANLSIKSTSQRTELQTDGGLANRLCIDESSCTFSCGVCCQSVSSADLASLGVINILRSPSQLGGHMHQLAMQYTRVASWPVQCVPLNSLGAWMCVLVGGATSPCRHLAGRIVRAALGSFQGLPSSLTACGGARYLSGTALRPHRPVK